ncbi:ribosome biogenesis protein Nop16 [Lyophyllum atratum]|nr:ribosome biogenesis protein Nop16 [Lyophyllum atratum]
MANPRQRRKSRSSSYKPVSHSRHAKRNLKKMPPIRGPKVLQDSWDRKKTVRQNYATLGLVHTLNPSAAGGIEPLEEQSQHIEESQIASTSQLKQPSQIPKGFGKIIRDEAGNVLRIEMPEEDDAPPFEKPEDMEMAEPGVDDSVLRPWVIDMGGGEKFKLRTGDTNVVQALERISTTVNQNSTTLSAPLSDAGPRHASAGEVAYLERLVTKYGEDVERMARDRKLNPEQRTAGVLRRALKKAGLGGRS